MTPIQPLGKISLTKFKRIVDVLDELAKLVPGESTAADVYRNPTLKPLWNDLVLYDPLLESDREPAQTQVVLDDELLTAAREQRSDRLLLAWCALLIADDRLEEITREILTLPDGRFDSASIGRQPLFDSLSDRGLGDEPNKITTNILSDMVQCQLFVPYKSGSSVLSVQEFLPTSPAVPGLLRLLKDRIDHWRPQFSPPDETRLLDFALSLGANHWLGLTRDEFRRAAERSSPHPQSRRSRPPVQLEELAAQLENRGQVVLQGPPGTGKTYLAKSYVEWATSGRRQESRLQKLLDDLPMNERTPSRVADKVESLGLSAIWDIVQFHPSYEYNDFVRTLVAEPIAGGVTFVPRHRVLSFIAAVGMELSTRGSATELVLILDEVNRGNIPSIFGELLYALEYRDEPVATPYPIDGDASITIPRHLKLIGTMNTADRSIAVIDYALRRRFVFLDVPASADPIVHHPHFHGIVDRAAALRLFKLVSELLRDASSGIQVGPSYFLIRNGSADDFENIRSLASSLVYEVLPLLGEYALEGELEETNFKAFKEELGIAGLVSQTEMVNAVTDFLTVDVQVQLNEEEDLQLGNPSTVEA